MTSFWRAYVLFTGGVIGVGFFGIPYVIVHAGVVPTFLIGALVLAAVWLVHVLFLDLVLRTNGRRRFPGYIGVALGAPAKMLATIANVFGLVSALLAYLVIGGTFLSLVLTPFVPLSPLTASLLYAALAVIVLVWKHRTLFALQVGILLLFALTLGILWVGTGSLAQWSLLPLVGTANALILPYGVLLFSFWSLSLIPELVELLGRKRDHVRRVLRAGFFTAALTYAAFGLLVAAVSGSGTTEDAFTGLARLVPPGLVVVGALFGILTTFDSFLALSLTLAKTLTMDFRVSSVVAWGVTLVTPLLLFLAGVNRLVVIASVTGAVFLGIEGLLVLCAMGLLSRSKARGAGSAHPRWIIVGAALLLLGGVVFEVVHVLSG